MKQVAIFSIKGGVGKSTVSAGFCRALRDRDYKVGYCEIDISGTSGHRAFGLATPPPLQVDTATSKIVPPLVEGIKMLPLASKFSEDACVTWRVDGREIQIPDGSTIVDRGRIGIIQDLLTGGVDWGDLDWLVYDLPPSSSEESFSFFELISELFGVIIVSHPTSLSTVGAKKTIDMLKTVQQPVIGLVENMSYFLCPNCGTSVYPFLDAKSNMVALCHQYRIPLLVSIPQSNDPAQLKVYFDTLVTRVLTVKPRILKQEIFTKSNRFKRFVTNQTAQQVLKWKR